MKTLFITILLSLVSSFVIAQDTLQAVFTFKCGEMTVENTQATGIEIFNRLSETTILSIEGYASKEGNIKYNQVLAEGRAVSIYHLIEAFVESADYETAIVVGNGPTTKFGSNLSDNRIVVVTYVTNKFSSTPVNKEYVNTFAMKNTTNSSVNTNIISFDTINTSFDTIININSDSSVINDVVVDTNTISIALIDLETITPELLSDTTIVAKKVESNNNKGRIVNTMQAAKHYKKLGYNVEQVKEIVLNKPFFVNPVTREIEQLDSTQIGLRLVPVERAIKHYRIVHKMSQEEAEAIVYNRETFYNYKTNTWEKIKLDPKSKKTNSKKAKSKKVKLRKTKGLSARGGWLLNKFFPYRNC